MTVQVSQAAYDSIQALRDQYESTRVANEQQVANFQASIDDCASRVEAYDAILADLEVA